VIRYLKTFATAARTASFSATGDQLGLTQSAVSTQIKRLEEDLGYTLFDRAGKSVALNAQGRQALVATERILELYDALKGGQGRAASTPIAIGAISTAQLGLLPRALRGFREAFPDVHVNVLPGMSVQLLSQIDAQELDAAVMIKPNLGIPKDLKWLPLMQEPYVAIAPARSRGTLETLLRTLPFIRYNRRSYGGQPVDQFLKRQRWLVNDIMELDEPAVILRMVREGLGCAILPGLLAGVRSDKVRVLELPGPAMYREIGVLVRQAALKDPVLKALVDSLAAEAESISARQG
jgi:DNA-binding transcriptional LysR family regulator